MTRESAPKGAPEPTATIASDTPEVTTEVLDRLDAIAANSAYCLLGLLPVTGVLEGNARLAERAALFLRAVA